MHSASVKGVGNNAVCEMNFGTSVALHDKNSILVEMNRVEETCLTPFTNMSALVPFHFIAILVVSVVVV